jgi:D-isomer specific 2-hydroxyacid dehydrogenase-like protein
MAARFKAVRTDRELECPGIDDGLRAAGCDLVTLPDGVSEADLIAATRAADLLLMCYTPITAHVIEAAEKLKGIVKYGVGIDAIDIGAAQRPSAQRVVRHGQRDLVPASDVLHRGSHAAARAGHARALPRNPARSAGGGEVARPASARTAARRGLRRLTEKDPGLAAGVFYAMGRSRYCGGVAGVPALGGGAGLNGCAAGGAEGVGAVRVMAGGLASGVEAVLTLPPGIVKA